MEKKGNLLTIGLIMAVVGILVALMLPKAVQDSATGKIQLKAAYARDLALTLNVICSYSYDIDVEYGINLENFILSVSDRKVAIYDKYYVNLQSNKVMGKDPTVASYPFSCKNTPDTVIDSPKKIKIAKKDGNLGITKMEDASKK